MCLFHGLCVLPGVEVIAVPPECVGLLAAPCRPPAPKALPKRKVAKSQGEAKAKGAAKSKPVAKSKRKVGETQRARKAKAKAKPAAKNRPAKVTSRRRQLTQEQRDRAARKSNAYHHAKRQTVANGGSLDEALAAGRAVLWTAC